MVQIKDIDGNLLHTLDIETLKDADLRGLDLRRADLRGVDFGRAQLDRADLRGADLSEAWLDLVYGWPFAETQGAKTYGARMPHQESGLYLPFLGF